MFFCVGARLAQGRNLGALQMNLARIVDNDVERKETLDKGRPTNRKAGNNGRLRDHKLGFLTIHAKPLPFFANEYWRNSDDDTYVETRIQGGRIRRRSSKCS